MLRPRLLSVWSVLSLSCAPDLLAHHDALCLLLSTCTPDLEARLSPDLSKQDHCFTEGNTSVYMLSNTKGIHLLSLSENKGSLNWMTEMCCGIKSKRMFSFLSLPHYDIVWSPYKGNMGPPATRIVTEINLFTL